MSFSSFLQDVSVGRLCIVGHFDLEVARISFLTT